MPELPAIGPEAIGFGSRVANIPENPELPEIQKASAEVNRQLRLLSSSISLQQQNDKNADAMIDYKSQEGQLVKKIQSISDLDERYKQYSSGLQAIQADIQKKHPGISAETFKSIQLSMVGDSRQAFLRKVTDQRKQAEKDFPLQLKSFAKIASESASDTERKHIENTAYNYIDSSLKNGLISKTDADNAKINFGIDVTKNHYDQLLASGHAGTILAIPFNKSGLPLKDKLEYNQKAYEILTRNESAAMINWKQKENQAFETANKNNAQSLYNKGLITNGYAKYILGHKPVESDEMLTDHFTSQIEDAKSDEELTGIYIHALNSGVTGTGRTIITTLMKDRKTELKTEHGQNAQDLYDDIKNNIQDSDATYYMPEMEGFSGNRKFNDQVLREAKRTLKYAKSPEEMYKSYNNIMNNIAKRYKTGTASTVIGPGEKAPTPEAPTPEALTPEVKPGVDTTTEMNKP